MAKTLSPRILPVDFERYISKSISELTVENDSFTVSVLSDYGYFDENGRLDVNGPDDGDYIDYRVFKVIVATFQKSNTKSNHIITYKLYTIEPEPEDGNYTVLNVYDGNVKKYTSFNAEREFINLLKPYYINWNSSDPIPVRSVLTNLSTMRTIISNKYSLNKKDTDNIVLPFVELLISSATSDMQLYLDDGETSRWEAEVDKTNRVRIIYPLLYLVSYDDSLGGSSPTIINAIRQKY